MRVPPDRRRPGRSGSQPERAAPQRGAQPRGATAPTPAMTRSSGTAPTRTGTSACPVKAGEREITVAFLKKTSAVDETVRLPFLRPYPAGNNVPESRMGAALRSVEISGPHTPGVAGDTPSRRRIFVCRPPAAAAAAVRTGNAAPAGEAACAQDDPLDAGAPRLPAPGHRRRPRAAAGALRRGPDRRADSRAVSSGR